MKRQGQAAVEFLTTYGWMLLIIVVVMGALWQFGVFDFSSRIPSSCYFGTEFDCGAFMISTNGSIGFELTNLLPKTIILNKSVVTFSEKSYSVDFSEASLSSGETKTIFLSPSNSIPLSGKVRAQVQLIYQYDEDSALPRIVSGEIIADVTDDQTIIDEYYQQATISFSSFVNNYFQEFTSSQVVSSQNNNFPPLTANQKYDVLFFHENCTNCFYRITEAEEKNHHGVWVKRKDPDPNKDRRMLMLGLSSKMEFSGENSALRIFHPSRALPIPPSRVSGNSPSEYRLTIEVSEYAGFDNIVYYSIVEFSTSLY